MFSDTTRANIEGQKYHSIHAKGQRIEDVLNEEELMELKEYVPSSIIFSASILTRTGSLGISQSRMETSTSELVLKTPRRMMWRLAKAKLWRKLRTSVL